MIQTFSLISCNKCLRLSVLSDLANQPNLDTKERLHVDVETKALSEDETSCWESEKASDSEYHVMIKSGE